MNFNLFFLNLTFLVLPILGKHVFETLEISRSQSSPDCFQMSTLVINGKFGGPELRFNQGDILHLAIKNRFEGEISIHLHGISQIGSVESDGASGVTQLAIKPGKDQMMVSLLDRPGTYLYHAHHELFDLHVYGSLIVEGDRQSIGMRYDDEKTLILSEHFHKSPETLTEGLLTTPNFTWIGAPDSFLTNYQSGQECNNTHIVQVDKGKVYRIRLVGASTLFVTYFVIPKHKMYVVEVEGEIVKPLEVEYVEVMPGQRYSVLVAMDQEGGEFEMRFEGRYRTGAPVGVSVLKYGNVGNGTRVKGVLPGDTPGWVNDQFRPVVERVVPENANPPLVLVGRQIKYGPGGTQRRWTVNNVTFEFPNTTSILETFQSNKLDSLPLSQKPLGRFRKGEIVDMVFQNTRALNGVCEVHPWHIHGHSFIAISTGTGKYPEGEKPLGHILRDTIGVYGGEGKDECGWTRIRFEASNVGVWAVHCHIISHYAMGMGGTFVVEDGVLSGASKMPVFGVMLVVLLNLL